MSSVLFLIEGGEPLTLVKRHISEVKRVREEVTALSKEIGVARGSTDRFNGTLLGVVFEGAVPDGWTKPDRKHGLSFPKKGSSWSARFQEHQRRGFKSPVDVISSSFGVPCSISYRTPSGHGSTFIGNMLAECGWLYLSESGPFAMWIPDVEAEVKNHTDQGHVVEEPAASFKPLIPGARRIVKEEWDLLVAQHQLDKKRQALAAEGGAA